MLNITALKSFLIAVSESRFFSHPGLFLHRLCAEAHFSKAWLPGNVSLSLVRLHKAAAAALQLTTFYIFLGGKGMHIKLIELLFMG